MSERARRSALVPVAIKGGAPGAPSVEERAVRTLWIPRAELLEIFAERDNAFTAGLRVWEVS